MLTLKIHVNPVRIHVSPPVHVETISDTSAPLHCKHVTTLLTVNTVYLCVSRVVLLHRPL